MKRLFIPIIHFVSQARKESSSTTVRALLSDRVRPAHNATVGVLEDGETRLFFSSKQVEYLSYWLHAMEITPELIPVPHSSYLVPESSLRKVSPVVFTQNYELKKALKDIDKSNKRLKGAAPTLKSQRVYFEQVRTFWWDKVGTWLAIDFEGWELDHTLITEFGWSSVRWVDGEPVEDRGHIIIDEHQHYYNGQYVPDERNVSLNFCT